MRVLIDSACITQGCQLSFVPPEMADTSHFSSKNSLNQNIFNLAQNLGMLRKFHSNSAWNVSILFRSFRSSQIVFFLFLKKPMFFFSNFIIQYLIYWILDFIIYCDVLLFFYGYFSLITHVMSLVG